VAETCERTGVTQTWLERYDQQIADGFLGANHLQVGLSNLLGIELEEFAPGYLRAVLDVRPEFLTPIGNLHGGTLATLVDHVLGCVVYPHISRGQWAATTEFKINYLNPVTGGRLIGEARIINMTRRIAVAEVTVKNAERLVAAAQGTVTIVDPRPNDGRRDVGA
jgi:1,4-dihydroxy-2-naphthoyl-CoA hydrolase